jgi:hypothetical protein
MRVKEAKKMSINGKRYICVNYVCQTRLLCPAARVLKVDPVNGIPKYETRILAI